MRIFWRSAPIAILSAALIAAPLMAVPRSPSSSPVGVILQADHATLGTSMTSENSPIFEGDILQTDRVGTLRARFGGSQVDLYPNTAAQIHTDSTGFSASLLHGTVVASSAEGRSFEVISDGTTIRAASMHPTVAQITWVSARTLLLTSRRGTLLVLMGNEVETIEAGNSFRLEVQPDAEPQGPVGAGAPSYAAHTHFILIAIAAVAATTGLVIWRLKVSPDAP